MTAAEIRDSFLSFFRDKGHTTVPSASLMPTSPNLLFTNAGMNQFVPYFLGTQKAPYDPPRAADTQKCIRAGGKHNDLEDVGLDTYHHTFFEMLGNWSFGDYFKKDAINWAWELVVETWGFPPNRLYATVYAPGDGDPAEFDQEAYDHWKALFLKAGLDPEIHIVNGNVKDNFWMMGDTGPCGPCSELHVDLTPEGDTNGALVNKDDARCIEIWNLVFIQFNAEPDGSYRDLPAKHVDTGMGFERACAIIQGTKNFTDFSTLPSNYDTDVFTPLFQKLEQLSGQKYTRTLPSPSIEHRASSIEHRASSIEHPESSIQKDIAFRVIADHIRTLSFSIADGILPGNTDRNYVLRRILRRAVRYGRNLGLGTDGTNFLPQLVPVLVEEMAAAFPELKQHQDRITETLDTEESAFNKTLDRGIKLFNAAAEKVSGAFEPETAFELYDTYGFPTDLTALMAAERGLTLDLAAVESHMEQQRERARAAHTSETVTALDFDTDVTTTFTGYDTDSSPTTIHDILDRDGNTYAIIDTSPFYVEMGGQVGDIGSLTVGDESFNVTNVSSVGAATILQLSAMPSAWTGQPREATVALDTSRRRDIEKHHTATHILHWALHEIVSPDATQQGSYVGPDRLRFDFSSKALTKEQLQAVEKLANEKIKANDPVSWSEQPYDSVKGNENIMQFFGDKYGDTVRVVQIGGAEGSLDGWSMELCAGTHVRQTGDIEQIVIKKEEAIAAGIRRIEAVCGSHAQAYLDEAKAGLEKEIHQLANKLTALNAQLSAADAPTQRAPDAPDPGDTSSALTAYRDALKKLTVDADKSLKKIQTANLAQQADAQIDALIANAAGDPPVIIEALENADGNLLGEFINALKKKQFKGVAILAAAEEASGKVHLGIAVHPDLTSQFKAGDLMQKLAPIVGGRGGGKPDFARGAGSDPTQIDALLEAARNSF
ncbi:MAG: alanine--tRNA ligase [Verrucomicrobiota bacterium]